jgi:oligoendopeptidase F
MDYKGYNIAVHEFGHNVEQTISLYDVDYYMLSGVPNTAFTEATAFLFQDRDLMLLGMKEDNPEKEKLQTLDAAWSLMEIMGVSMVEMKLWKWLYENPQATAAELREQTVTTAVEVWNKYFAPVMGTSDSPLLAIYSHMINGPLYLQNYAYGQIIQFQIEDHLKGKDFSDEIDRMYSLGRLTPQHWMNQAAGVKISAQPVLTALGEALK